MGSGVRRTIFSSTRYALVSSEDHREWTTSYSACELFSISICQKISPQALSAFYNAVGFSPSRIQFGAVRLFYLGLVLKSQVANLEIVKSEVSRLVGVLFVGISRLLYVLYGSIDSFSQSFQLPCSSCY